MLRSQICSIINFFFGELRPTFHRETLSRATSMSLSEWPWNLEASVSITTFLSFFFILSTSLSDTSLIFPLSSFYLSFELSIRHTHTQSHSHSVKTHTHTHTHTHLSLISHFVGDHYSNFKTSLSFSHVYVKELLTRLLQVSFSSDREEWKNRSFFQRRCLLSEIAQSLQLCSSPR